MTPSSAAPASSPMRNSVQDDPAPRRSRFIPWLFVGGFAVVIAVNGALIYFAQSSFSGLETEQPYERGLQYNQTLAAAAAQEKLGWRADIVVADPAAGPRALEVTFTGKQGQPLDGLQVEAFLVRPSNSGMDVTATLAPAGDGRYTGSVTLPALGQWELRVVARDGTNAWQRSERLFLK